MYNQDNDARARKIEEIKRQMRESRKKTKEDSKNKVMKIINTASVFLFCTTGLAVTLGFLIFERPEISNVENRTLAKIPSFSVEDYFDGKYTADLELFYNDTVPGRETYKHWVAKIRDSFGVKSEEGTVKIHGTIIDKKNLDKKTEEETTEKPTEAETEAVTEALAENNDAGTAVSKTTAATTKATTTTPKEEEEDPLDDPNIDGEVSNSILVYDNRGIMLYGGTKSNAELYAQYVNNFKADLGDDVNVYSMVCPTPVSYYLPKKYLDLTADEKENIEYINKHLDGVIPVDAWGALDKHTDEKIYAYTDHHWTQLGAYYAAEEFAKTAGVPFAPLSQYDRVDTEGYVGSLYGYTGDTTLRDNPETFTYYIPKAKYTSEMSTPDLSESWEGSLVLRLDNIDPVSWYCVFIGSDDVVTHVKTEVKNGRKLAVIKDSYGNATIPCFTSSFEDIFVIDMRYFEVNAINYLKENGVTDVLFAMNTFSATGSNFENIETIRTQW